MGIIEVGILMRGLPIVYIENKLKQITKTDIVLKSGLISGLLTFAEISMEKVQSMEGEKFIIVFSNSMIASSDIRVDEPIIVYAIIEKEKKVDKIIERKLIPLLEKTLEVFIQGNSGKNFTEVSQFKYFKEFLYENFLVSEKEKKKIAENKFKSIF